MVAAVRFVALFSLLLLASIVPPALAQGPALTTTSIPTTDPHPEIDRWVEGALQIAQPDFTTMSITSFLTIRKFEVEGTDYSSADEISDAYFQLVQADEFARANGQESNRAENFVADMENETTQAMRDMLTRAFPGAEIDVSLATLDRDTLVEPDDQPFAPGIELALTASVVRTAEQVGLGDSTSEDAQALLDVGAEITTDVTFNGETGYDLSYVLQAPGGNVFTDASAGTLDATGSQLVLEVPSGSARTPVTLSLRSASAPELTKANATIDVLVDLTELDVSLGQALGGDFGNLLVDLEVDATMQVVEVPDTLKASLPSKVKLDFLSADGLRLLVEKGLISDANLTSLDTKLLDQVKEKLGAALGGTIPVAGGLDRASLAASVADGKPVVFHATASVLKPISGGPVQPQAAIALYTQQLPLTLPKIQGLDTVYTIIAPPGLAFTDVTGPDANIQMGTSEDGRDQVVVTPQSDSARITASVAVTPGLVIAKFWPVLLLAIIVLVLIVGTPIALVVRGRNKKKAAAAKPAKKE